MGRRTRSFWPTVAVMTSLLLVVAAGAAQAGVVDDDVLGTGGASSVPFGVLVPGSSDTSRLNLFLACNGLQHANRGTMSFTSSVTLNPGSFGSAGEVSALGDLTIPSTWPSDGVACGATADARGFVQITVTVLPKAVGGPRDINVRLQSTDPDVSNPVDIEVTYSVPGLDSTPPVITPNVSGTAGSHGWYTSDVTVSWSVTDPESTVTSQSGCGPTTITTDTTGTTLTCTAASAGGTNSQSVTIMRDATLPMITPTVTPAPNPAGWNNTPVTVSFACSDATSGIDPNYGCPPDQTLTANGHYELHVSTADMAGNVISPTFVVDIDAEAPTIFGSASPAANAYGWNNTDVTVHFECFDSRSGIKSCPADQVLSTEGGNLSVTGTAVDVADNSASATVEPVRIDEHPPTITFAGTTPASPNANGWFDSNVTLTWDCADPLSGVVASTVSQTLSSDGAGQSATGTCQDKAGNTASDTQTGFSIDTTPPAIRFVGRTPANADGWNRSDVTVTWACTDALSDVVHDSVTEVVTSEGAGQSATGTCEDLAGNTASDTVGDINIDRTAPTIAFAGQIPPANGYGWNNSPVILDWACTDGLSGPVDSLVSQTLTSEGTGLSATGTCRDRAGNSASDTHGGVMIDETAPTDVHFVGGIHDGDSFSFGSVPAAPTCTATDALSGLDTCVVSGYSGSVGPHTLVATATDKAGNQTQKTLSYTVLPWTVSGFYPPVDRPDTLNVTKGGSTVPLKFEVFAGSAELTDTAIVDQPLTATQIACQISAPADAIELTATGGTSLRYDGGSGHFIFNWQTPTLPGTCWTVTVRAADGSSISADFELK